MVSVVGEGKSIALTTCQVSDLAGAAGSPGLLATRSCGVLWIGLLGIWRLVAGAWLGLLFGGHVKIAVVAPVCTAVVGRGRCILTAWGGHNP